MIPILLEFRFFQPFSYNLYITIYVCICLYISLYQNFDQKLPLQVFAFMRKFIWNFEENVKRFYVLKEKDFFKLFELKYFERN